jgi:hypothetical protein
MKFAMRMLGMSVMAVTPCMAQITGTLVNSGNQPIAGCEVKMGSMTAMSDATGAFQLSAVSILSTLHRQAQPKGFEIFNVQGRSGLERSATPYVIRYSSAPGTSLSVSLKKASAADSLAILCTGYPLHKVAVTSPNQKFGNITVPKDTATQGAHIDYNPYTAMTSNWYKVITHSHTKAHEAEKQTTPTKIAQAYKDLGMHAVAFTDHDVMTTVTPVAGILYIRGEEVTTSDGDMNVFGINKTIPGNMNGQKVIDAAIAAGNGFTQVNHPLDSDANDAGRLTSYLNGLKNLWGIEIYNGGRLDQDGTAAWDGLISQKKRIWATSGDDAHSILVIDDGAGVPETGRKWNVVNAPELTVDAILASMRAGKFYATEGPDMNISVSGDVVTVHSAPGNTVTWFSANRKQIKKTTLSNAPDTYTLTGSETFVRVLVTDSKGKRAASQPIFTK